MQQDGIISGGGTTRSHVDTCSTASQSINMDIADVVDADICSCHVDCHPLSPMNTSRKGELTVDSHAGDVDYTFSTPPSTPRLRKPVACDRQAGLAGPRQAPSVIGSLLDAFLRDDARQVRLLLDGDREAANEPFVDNGWEPPLCAAIRLHLSEEIVELLLSYGASVHATDVHNKTPLEVLSSLTDPANNPVRLECHLPLYVLCWLHSHDDPVKIQSLAFKEWSISVARHLTFAGTDATSIEHANIESAVQMARQNGNLFFVEFLEGLNRKGGTNN